MTTTRVRTITKPSYFRNRINEGAADITRGKILKVGAGSDGCALATSTGDEFCGVSTETMEGTTAGAITRSVQVGGKVMVTSGAAIAIGDRLTTDSSGRSIPATGTNQSTIGIAQTAATAANEDVECELSIGARNAAGGLQCLEMQIEHTDLSDADTSQSFALGTVPANSWIVGYQMVLTEAFVKGAQTFIGQIGILGTLGAYADNLDVDGSTGTTQAAVSKSPETDAAVLCTITTNTGTLASSTAGDVTLRLFFMACTPVEVAAA
jgi:hypothetical protein